MNCQTISPDLACVLRSLARQVTDGEMAALIAGAVTEPGCALERLDDLQAWAMASFPLALDQREALRQARAILLALAGIARVMRGAA